MRKTVLLQAKYKNLNPGEFAGFEDAELAHVLGEKFAVSEDDGRGNMKSSKKPIAILAINVQAVKAFTAEQRHKLLNGEAKHLNRDYEPGDRFSVAEAHATALIKAGLCEPLEEVVIRAKELKDGSGNLVGLRDQKVAMTSKEAMAHADKGAVRRLSAAEV